MKHFVLWCDSKHHLFPLWIIKLCNSPNHSPSAMFICFHSTPTEKTPILMVISLFLRSECWSDVKLFCSGRRFAEEKLCRTLQSDQEAFVAHRFVWVQCVEPSLGPADAFDTTSLLAPFPHWNDRRRRVTASYFQLFPQRFYEDSDIPK